MEQASYWISLAAFVTVISCWLVFAGTFLLRKKPAPSKDAVKAPKSWLGIALQGLAYLPVWALHRSPMFSPFVGSYAVNIALQLIAALLSISSVYLTMTAIRELGKQWSLEARLVERHDLVMTGPYNLVRHPIYTAMLGKLIATGIVMSHWAVLIPAVVVFLIGTFIRTRFEERLLGDAFGKKFFEWKARVPGLIPFLK
ncbi:MAG TPA: isoprenylcysteine carboxylmethyltransferase family protein [Pyrinomonadaceae bacterium]|nr:isoprenylcysteine carboxylmethyltransferase family protein [Pyrinomonadaceae bacterium]